MMIASSKLFAMLSLGVFLAGGAAIAFFALPASATDRSVDIRVRCDGIWTGSLQWTLDGTDLPTSVDLSCPDFGGSTNFRLNVPVPVTGPVTGTQVHANDFRIDTVSTSTTNAGSPLADCQFRRDFDADDLGTIKSTANCSNDGAKGNKLSHHTTIR